MNEGFGSRLRGLMRVHPGLPPEQARRARLASALLGAIALVGLISLASFTVLLGGPWDTTRWTSLVGLAALFAGYALTKTRRPELGPLLACIVLLAVIGILHSVEEGTNTYVFYTAIPLLTAGLLLPRRELIIVLGALFLVLVPADVVLDDNEHHGLTEDLESTVFLVLVAAMSLAFATLTNQDIRALRDAGDQLAEANATIRRKDAERVATLQQLAHDLASPLTAVTINLRLLRDSGADPKRLNGIDKGLRQQRRLIEDVRDLARLEGGKMALRRERVDVAKLAQDLSESLRPAAMERGVTLAVDAPMAAVANIDADRINQVLANLVGNALKFTPPGKAIRVKAESMPSLVALTVTDQGVGMTAEQISRLFQPFSQVHDPKSIQRPEDKGTGLGLYICKGLVEAHGGSIHVASAGPGRGTEFRVELPIA